jgi:hypothetical protein
LRRAWAQLPGDPTSKRQAPEVWTLTARSIERFEGRLTLALGKFSGYETMGT